MKAVKPFIVSYSYEWKGQSQKSIREFLDFLSAWSFVQALIMQGIVKLSQYQTETFVQIEEEEDGEERSFEYFLSAENDMFVEILFLIPIQQVQFNERGCFR